MMDLPRLGATFPKRELLLGAKKGTSAANRISRLSYYSSCTASCTQYYRKWTDDDDGNDFGKNVIKEEEQESISDWMDLGGLTNYLLPWYTVALLGSLAVNAAFFKFVLMDYWLRVSCKWHCHHLGHNIMLLIIEIILIVSSTKLKSILDLAALYGELVISPCFIYIFIMSMYMIYIMLSVLYQSNEFPSTTSTLTSRSKDVYFFSKSNKTEWSLLLYPCCFSRVELLLLEDLW
jgi:hypothetical protein